MLPDFSQILKRLFSRSNRTNGTAQGRRSVRLQLEQLEDRSVPTANASGIITGMVLINSDSTTDSLHSTLSGVDVSLTGTTDQGSSVSATATTDAAGAFTFGNVLPGTYQLAANPVENYLMTGSGGSATVTVSAGETVTQNVGYEGGLDPNSISMRQFLTSTTSNNYVSNPAGDGQARLNERENNTPTIASTLGAVTVAVNSNSTVINLGAYFSDPDVTDSRVTFNIINGGVASSIKVTLLDTVAPQTVANFFDYVNSGAYDNIFFTRLVSNFVLQGGGAQLNADGTVITAVPTNPAVPNEFGVSNDANTLAMALSAGDINSGTNQFFFNLADNSSSLDPQRFAVFGRVDDIESIINLATLGLTSTQNMSARPVAATMPAVGLSNVPLTGYTGANFPTDATLDNYMRIDSIAIDRRDEFLTYSVTSSNPSLVSAILQNRTLTLDYMDNQFGSATITVTATDRFGATVVQTFNVTVQPGEPDVTAVAIAPDNASNVSTLTATPTATDPQALPITFAYQWLQNGTEIPGATAATLNLTTRTVNTGDTFAVEVTPSNSVLTGDPFVSAVVTIATVNPITLV